MMKKLKQCIASLLAAISCFSLFACGRTSSNSNNEGSSVSGTINSGDPNGDSSSTPNYTGPKEEIQIYFWRSGLGEDFITKVISNFEKKYPQYRVKFDSTTWVGTISNYLGLEDADKVDLWMFDQAGVLGRLTEYAEPLDDILTSNAYGDSVTIGSKFRADVLETFKNADGHYYSLPYGGGTISLVYDADIIDDLNYAVPYTTNELEALVGELSNAGHAPFMNFVGGGYWGFIYKVWQAQYDGYDYYNNNFLTLTDDIGNSPSLSVLTKADGRRKALDVLEGIMTPQSVAEGSNGYQFTEAQTNFLNGEAVMMANGAWLMNEMKDSTDVSGNYAMMKIPVISSIIEKTPSIANDTELIHVINAIDKYNDWTEVPLSAKRYEVKAEDMEYVFKARNMMFSSYASSSFIIPTYSNQKAGAREFMKYYYSDEALEVYFNETRMLPIANLANKELDKSTLSDWENYLMNFGLNSIPLAETTASTSVMFLRSGCQPFAGLDIITLLSNANSQQRKNAQQIWDDMTGLFNGKWSGWLKDAGVS